MWLNSGMTPSLASLLADLPAGITTDRSVPQYGRRGAIGEFTRLRAGDQMLDVWVNADDPSDIDLVIDRPYADNPHVPAAALAVLPPYARTSLSVTDLPAVLADMVKVAR